MTDDLVKRLRDREDLSSSYGITNTIFGEAASSIEHLERELAEERHSREVAASKGWEFSDRIKDTEKECADVLIAGADRIEKLEAALRVAAGYISTKEGHTDQHPQDVYDWIIQATVEKKND